MTPPLTHPAWCNPEHCTVVGELLPLTGTAHKSRPVEFDLGVLEHGRRRKVAVQLSQSVAPWPTDVFVVAFDGDGDELLSMRAEAAQHMLATLGALIGRAFPVIADEFPSRIARNHGSPASAEDDFCRVHDGTVCVDWVGESDAAENVWTCRDSGVQWRTLVRRPGNGAPYALVIPAREGEWVVECLACNRDLAPPSPTEEAANAAAALHTAEHEAALGGGG